MLYAAGEIILSLLAVFGLFSALWLLFRRAMFAQAGDQPGACAVVAARGDGSGLEQTVKELLWLRLGGARHYAVLIADAGLDWRSEDYERVSFAGGSCDTYGRTGLSGRRAS